MRQISFISADLVQCSVSKIHRKADADNGRIQKEPQIQSCTLGAIQILYIIIINTSRFQRSPYLLWRSWLCSCNKYVRGNWLRKHFVCHIRMWREASSSANHARKWAVGHHVVRIHVTFSRRRPEVAQPVVILTSWNVSIPRLYAVPSHYDTPDRTTPLI